MVNSFALVSAAVGMRVEDYFARGKQPRCLFWVMCRNAQAEHITSAFLDSGRCRPERRLGLVEPIGHPSVRAVRRRAR